MRDDPVVEMHAHTRHFEILQPMQRRREGAWSKRVAACSRYAQSKYVCIVDSFVQQPPESARSQLCALPCYCLALIFLCFIFLVAFVIGKRSCRSRPSAQGRFLLLSENGDRCVRLLGPFVVPERGGSKGCRKVGETGEGESERETKEQNEEHDGTACERPPRRCCPPKSHRFASFV